MSKKADQAELLGRLVGLLDVRIEVLTRALLRVAVREPPPPYGVEGYRAYVRELVREALVGVRLPEPDVTVSRRELEEFLGEVMDHHREMVAETIVVRLQAETKQ